MFPYGKRKSHPLYALFVTEPYLQHWPIKMLELRRLSAAISLPLLQREAPHQLPDSWLPTTIR